MAVWFYPFHKYIHNNQYKTGDFCMYLDLSMKIIFLSFEVQAMSKALGENLPTSLLAYVQQQ
jgi:hypothetical protein